MSGARKAPAKGARSGPNIREGQRRTAAIKLRLRPERAEEIRALAREYGVDVSAVVDAAMGAALSDGRLVTLLSLAKMAGGA